MASSVMCFPALVDTHVPTSGPRFCSLFSLPQQLGRARHAQLLRPQVRSRSEQVPVSIKLRLPPGSAKAASFSERHEGDLKAVRAVDSPSLQLQEEADSVAMDIAAPAQDSSWIDRRQLLTASVASIPFLSSQPLAARATPVSPPDLSKCKTALIFGTTKDVHCCLPVSKKAAKLFVPTKATLQPKTRRAANRIDADYVAKYNKAYELMRNLDSKDPRCFDQQALVHCAFCDGAYTVSSTNSADLQIHFSWIFFPWHRYYLYFHERILASLIGDPSFALAYWNWDDQLFGGNVIPTMYNQKSVYPALYDANRNQKHLTTINTLSLTDETSTTTLTNSQISADNLNVMYQSVVTASTPSLFFGTQPLFESLTDTTAGGTVELDPHTAVHAFAGDPKNPNYEDMGNLYSSANDPLFFSHHSNVDRLWTVWNTIGGRRKDFTNSDFLNSSFVFYDENADLVQCYVKDCLDSVNQLGIAYESAPGDKQWLNYDPQPSTGAKGVVPKGKDKLPEIGAAATGKAAKDISTTLTSLVARPSNAAEVAKSKKIKTEDIEEVLVLQDVKVPANTAVYVSVFINLPTADAKTSLGIAEFVGSYGNVPHGRSQEMKMNKKNARFGISDNIKRLGIADQTKIAVTLVTKVLSKGSITVGGLKIEYE